MMLLKLRPLLQSFSTLELALAASVVFHAGLLTVRFVDPEAFNRVFEDTPLEVILVNARSDSQAPEKAQAIGQTSLAGGAMPTKAAPPARYHRHSKRRISANSRRKKRIKRYRL